jgi:hypothetical protein
MVRHDGCDLAGAASGSMASRLGEMPNAFGPITVDISGHGIEVIGV